MTRKFYTEVLGFRGWYLPDFDFLGSKLYLGDVNDADLAIPFCKRDLKMTRCHGKQY